MNIITDRPIYSYAEGDAKMKTLGATELALKPLPTSLQSTVSKEDKQAAREKKQAERKLARGDKQAARKVTRAENKVERKEKRAERKAKRQANRLVRAKDKTGKKRWFYPIARVFNGKKRLKDGTVVEVAATDIVTTSNGAQFDKKEIAAASGVSPAQVTAQMVEQTAVSSNPNQTVTEETKLSPMVARPNEPAATTDPSADPTKNMSTIYYPVSENKQVTQTSDGATYLSEETIPMEEPEVDEDVEMRKKDSKEDKKGLGVWGWVGISAIVVGLGVATVLLMKMSKGKN